MNKILEYEQRFKDPLLSANKNNGHSIASTTVSVGWRPFPCSMERDVGSVTLWSKWTHGALYSCTQQGWSQTTQQRVGLSSDLLGHLSGQYKKPSDRQKNRGMKLQVWFWHRILHICRCTPRTNNPGFYVATFLTCSHLIYSFKPVAFRHMMAASHGLMLFWNRVLN